MPFEPKIKGGYLERYTSFVTSALQGAMLRRPGVATTPVNSPANGHRTDEHVKYGNSYHVL